MDSSVCIDFPRKPEYSMMLKNSRAPIQASSSTAELTILAELTKILFSASLVGSLDHQILGCGIHHMVFERLCAK